jgi:hypothetical protein
MSYYQKYLKYKKKYLEQKGGTVIPNTKEELKQMFKKNNRF